MLFDRYGILNEFAENVFQLHQNVFCHFQILYAARRQNVPDNLKERKKKISISFYQMKIVTLRVQRPKCPERGYNILHLFFVTTINPVCCVIAYIL